MIPDAYFQRFTSQKYQNNSRIQRALIRRFVSHFHALFVAALPAKKVCEIGIGQGFLSGYLSERFLETTFLGVDLEGPDLEQLRKTFPRIETHQADAQDLGLLKSHTDIDLVICAEVLEHLGQPDRALHEIAALHPKHVIVTVPNEPWFRLSNLARGKNVMRFGNDIDHHNHWNRRSLNKLLEAHFEVLQIDSAFPWLLALCKPRTP